MTAELAPVIADHRAEWARRAESVRQDVFREKSRLLVSGWAGRYRILTKGQMAGQLWSNDETPYLVEIMDTISSPDRPRKAVVMKSARVGYTEGVVGNGIGYCIDQEPMDVIVLQPTDEEADAYSKENLDPMFADTPALRKRLSLGLYKDGKNTIAYKKFSGGSLSVIGPKPSNLRRRSARIAFADEIDELDEAHEQGDPLARLNKRLDDFDDSILFCGSTPTTKGLSRIEKEFDGSDKRRWFVDCPECGEPQPLEWGGKDTEHGVKWDKLVFCRGCGVETEYGGECADCGSSDAEVKHMPETAHYVCVKGCVIGEREKRAMVQSGTWIATNPAGRYPGWHIHAVMSLFPGARWGKLAEEFLDALADPEKLKVFVNTVLGEAWEEPDRKKLSANDMEARAETYSAMVPDGVGVLTAGVDVQGDRLELLVRGYGVGRESWDILHERIVGDPENADTWARLDHLLGRTYEHESGFQMRILAAFIDAGYKPDVVYDFVRPREARNIWASRGDKGAEGAPPLKRPSRANSANVKVWTIGTFTMKDALFARIAVDVLGPLYTHFRGMDSDRCNGFDGEYFAELLAERKVRKRVKGTMKWVYQYVQTRKRNEAIDLNVMCDAALRALGPAMYENLDEWAENARKGVSVARDRSAKKAPARSWIDRPRGGWAKGV